MSQRVAAWIEKLDCLTVGCVQKYSDEVIPVCHSRISDAGLTIALEDVSIRKQRESNRNVEDKEHECRPTANETNHIPTPLCYLPLPALGHSKLSLYAHFLALRAGEPRGPPGNFSGHAPTSRRAARLVGLAPSPPPSLYHSSSRSQAAPCPSPSTAPVSARTTCQNSMERAHPCHT